MRAGRQAGALVRAARADAVAAHSPGPEPAARHRFRLLALTLGTAALAGWVGYGVLVGRAIGSSLRHPGDGPYFAGLLSGLGSWWADLGLGGQVLVIAAGVALIIALGGSLALALGASGVFSYVAGHGRGLSALATDPRRAIRDYLATATLGGIVMDLADFLLTFVPGGLLGKMVGTPARQLVTELRAARLWKRAPRETIETLDDLFRQRDVLVAARDAAAVRFDALRPAGYTYKDFAAKNSKDTRRALQEAGHDRDSIAQMFAARETLSRAIGAVSRASARIGEVGGEQLLRLDGYRIPDAFLSVHGTPGPKSLDGFGVKPTTESVMITVPEFKGVTATLDRTPRPTRFEGLAAQGTPPYVRDRMLTDPRVAGVFAEHPDLWAKAVVGDIDFTLRVITTRTPVDVTMTETPFTLTANLINALEQAINARLT